MLNDASGFKRIFIAAGFTDLRRGIDGLAGIIQFQFELDPHDKDTIFLFCGRRNDRIKALLQEGDGFLLLYKRVEEGSFKWPRNTTEALEISPQQYMQLMKGLEVIAKRPITQQDSPGNLMQQLCRKQNFYTIINIQKSNSANHNVSYPPKTEC